MRDAISDLLFRLLDGIVSWRPDPEPTLVGDRVARFAQPETPDEPSLALLEQPTPAGPVPASFKARPEFAHIGRWSMARLRIEPGTSLYGTGESAGPLLRNGRVTTCWNSDIPGYTDRSRSLYQSHPWVLAVRADGSAFGVLADTTRRCTIDLRDGIVFRVTGPTPRVYVIERDHPRDVVMALAELTGKMPMPPRWALGYHQCRYSYEPDARVRQIADKFRKKRIPCDVIWLDIDYMDGFRCFTFDKDKFPNPAGLNEHLHEQGFKTVWMIDPGIKVDPDDAVYETGREGDHFVRDGRGGEFHGRVWPGPCAFPDFTRAETRQWWAGLYEDWLKVGIDGVWNDMNEPAVFDQPDKLMPKTCRHRADDDLGGPDAHGRYHNVYGMLMSRATREGIARARPEKRPFVLTRATYIGGQRYAATWTGDNASDGDHLRWSIPMVLNLGLSGQPFSGPDIGGFMGDATPELFARWMGIGSLLPFARGHTYKGSRNHEPWSFGSDTEEACRIALDRRYRLLPYLYTLFHESATTGLPVARPVFFADPANAALRGVDDAFLLGDDLLIRAEIEPGEGCRSPMPGGGDKEEGGWVELVIESLPMLTEDASIDAGATGGKPKFVARPSIWWIPPPPPPPDPPPLPGVWIRRGSIVAIGPAIVHTDEKPLDPLVLVVCLDGSGRAQGELYEDAGDGFGYERGEYLLTRYTAERVGQSVTVSVADESGRMARPARGLIVVVVGDGTMHAAAGRDGLPMTIETTDQEPTDEPVRPQ
jgi:alpha-glucosidase